jgi:hypothetical protein
MLVASSGGAEIETLSFVRTLDLHSRPAQHPQSAARAVAIVRHDVARHDAPQTDRSRPHAAEQMPLATAAAAAAPAPAGARANAPAVYVATATAPANAPVPATPAPQDVAVANERDTNGYMPLGAEAPEPVLDPDVHKALAALGVHVTLIVTVDESGHTKNVRFNPPLDAAVQQRILSMLASASWDPAICGAGVACEGTATITL